MDLVTGILHRAELYGELKDGRNTGLTPGGVKYPPLRSEAELRNTITSLK